jgi:glucan phosphorylase
MIRSAADAKVPMIGVTLLDRKGYFDQKLDPSGRQTEEPASWAIGDRASIGAERDFRTADAAALYDKLENVVLPTFYRDRDRFLNIMLHSIALNGLFFNTQRMIEQYCLRAYFV